MSFKKIALFAPARKALVSDTLDNLVAFLQKQSIEYSLEETSLPSPTFGEHHDLIIVIGGDGSMLRASPNAARYQIPMLGINQGRLGFLTDLRASDLHTRLLPLLQGDYFLEERFFLETHFDDTTQKSCLALNDVVIASEQTPHMLEMEIEIDGEFVCSERADGLILSTPTGSTAYSLSGGGPIVHPCMDAIVILPMFSHRLTTRPLVVSAQSKIKIHLVPQQEVTCKVSCDGSQSHTLLPGDRMTIQKHTHTTLKLLHPTDYSYYENLRSKLHWGRKLTQE